MNEAPGVKARTEDRDGMRITWHQPITMDDGVTLRADIYRHIDENAKCPIILNYGMALRERLTRRGVPCEEVDEILESAIYYVSNSVSFLRVAAFALAHTVLSSIVFLLSGSCWSVSSAWSKYATACRCAGRAAALAPARRRYVTALSRSSPRDA